MFVLLEGPLEENSLMELWLGEVALEVQACPVGIPIIFLCILILTEPCLDLVGQVKLFFLFSNKAF